MRDLSAHKGFSSGMFPELSIYKGWIAIAKEFVPQAITNYAT
jgi:hypothetical protein